MFIGEASKLKASELLQVNRLNSSHCKLKKCLLYFGLKKISNAKSIEKKMETPLRIICQCRTFIVCMYNSTVTLMMMMKLMKLPIDRLLRFFVDSIKKNTQ